MAISKCSLETANGKRTVLFHPFHSRSGFYNKEFLSIVPMALVDKRLKIHICFAYMQIENK